VHTNLTLFLYNYVLIFNYIITQDHNYVLQKIENEKGIKIRHRVIYGKQKPSKCRNSKNHGLLTISNVQDLI
jgi:GTP cyclohydrolase III